jgi:hypothetical protein
MGGEVMRRGRLQIRPTLQRALRATMAGAVALVMVSGSHVALASEELSFFDEEVLRLLAQTEPVTCDEIVSGTGAVIVGEFEARSGVECLAEIDGQETIFGWGLDSFYWNYSDCEISPTLFPGGQFPNVSEETFGTYYWWPPLPEDFRPFIDDLPENFPFERQTDTSSPQWGVHFWGVCPGVDVFGPPEFIESTLTILRDRVENFDPFQVLSSDSPLYGVNGADEDVALIDNQRGAILSSSTLPQWWSLASLWSLAGALVVAAVSLAVRARNESDVSGQGEEDGAVGDGGPAEILRRIVTLIVSGVLAVAALAVATAVLGWQGSVWDITTEDVVSEIRVWGPAVAAVTLFALLSVRRSVRPATHRIFSLAAVAVATVAGIVGTLLYLEHAVLFPLLAIIAVLGRFAQQWATAKSAVVWLWSGLLVTLALWTAGGLSADYGFLTAEVELWVLIALGLFAASIAFLVLPLPGSIGYQNLNSHPIMATLVIIASWWLLGVVSGMTPFIWGAVVFVAVGALIAGLVYRRRVSVSD